MGVRTRPVRQAGACVTLPAVLLISLLSCPWIGSVYERCGSNSTSSPPSSGVPSSSCIRGVVLVVAGGLQPRQQPPQNTAQRRRLTHLPQTQIRRTGLSPHAKDRWHNPISGAVAPRSRKVNNPESTRSERRERRVRSVRCSRSNRGVG